MDRGRVVCAVGLGVILATAGLPGAALAADSGFGLAIDDQLEFPPRTFTFQGEAYTVSTVTRVDRGATVDVDARTPNDRVYRVLLYNTDRQIVAARRASGPTTVSFELSAYAAGSYMLTLYQDGNYRAFQPLLIRGYAVERPAVRAVDGGMRVAAGIRALRNRSFTGVSVAVANETHTLLRQSADRTDAGYATTIDTSGLAPDAYTVYVGVRGTDEAFGRDELLGFNWTRVRLAPNGSIAAPDGGAGGPAPTTVAASPTDRVLTPNEPGTTTADGPGVGVLGGLVAVVLVVIGAVGRQR